MRHGEQVTDARMPPIRPRIIESLVWLSALVAALFVAGFHPTAGDRTNVVLGGIALLYGTRMFLAHGGARITTLGLFNFAFALFVGYSGMAEGMHPVHRTSAGWVALAISAALCTQILVNVVAWRRASPSDEVVTMPRLADARRCTWIGTIGMAAIFTGQQLQLFEVSAALPDGAAFTSVVLVVIGLLFRADTRLISLRTGLALVALGLYAEVFFGGTGRLRLVALACVIGLLVTARFPHRSIKWAAVAVAPLALWYLAQQRLELQESIRAGGSAGHDGLESMTTSLLVLAQTIKAVSTGALEPSWGHTFLSVPFILVPETLHPSWVPSALGYQLVGLVDPGALGTGFSVAGTVYGEAYWNAGWLGLLLAVPLLGWVLAAIDARVRGTLAQLAERPQALTVALFWVMLTGGIADLVWNGTHVWIARHLARVPLLLLLAGLIWLQARREATSAGPAPLGPLPARPRPQPAAVSEG